MSKDKGVVKRVFVTPDKHFPLHDKKAISVVKKAIEIVKPDVYVDLGDVGEWHGCSHWQWKKKKRPPLEYQLPFIDKDIKDVNKGMDSIDESLDKANCKEKYMIEQRNSEAEDALRMDNIAMSNPSMNFLQNFIGQDVAKSYSPLIPEGLRDKYKREADIDKYLKNMERLKQRGIV